MRGHSCKVLLWLMLGTIAVTGARAANLPFPVAEAQIRTLTREQILDGIIEAVNRSTVSAQTSGRVREILVDVNDFVKQGETIIRLSDTEQRAALDQAQAAVLETKARYAEAQGEYRRISDLYAKRLVSKANMDAVTAGLDTAKAHVEAAQAGVSRAQEQLAYTVISAPYSGVVLERHVHSGESVQIGQPLMTGFSLERLRAVADVPQRLIESARRHAKARVFLPNDGGSVTAEQLTFFPYADPESNVFKVRVYLPEDTRDLYPGMFVKVGFVVGEESRLVVPKAAIAHRSELTGVYVVTGEGRVSLRQIRVGRLMEGDMVEVLAGLDAGERMALDPIRAGVYVKERQAEAAR